MHHMDYRRLFMAFAALVFLSVTSCGDSELDELPSRIQNFITTYYPNASVESVSEISSGYVARIRNGATLTFDSESNWVDINGNGELIPSVLLYDQLPTKLYEYLLTMEKLNGVYRLQRNDKEIIVTLHDTYLTYDRATETIRYPSVPSTVV